MSAACDRLVARELVYGGSGASGGGAAPEGMVASRCPRCDTNVGPPPDVSPSPSIFRCPECRCVLRNPNYTPPVSAAVKLGLRHFAGAVDLHDPALEPASVSVVWRCKACEPSDESVCCRVKRRKGVCLCTHKLADHHCFRKPPRGGGRPFGCGKSGCECRCFF